MGDTATAERQGAMLACDVLWIGEPTAAMSELPQHGARVQQVGLDQGVDRVTTHAPDLVILNAGSAQAAVQFAHALQQRRAGTTTPVTVLCDDDSVAPLHALERSGIAARLDLSASGEELALALHTQLQTQMDTSLARRLALGAFELEDWVALAKKNGVCGVVLATEAAHVMVLGPEGATVPTPQRFRDALAATSTEPLSFLQLPATRVRVLSEQAQAPFEGEVVDLPEVRVAVVHPDSETRSLWERHMASAGAEVLFDEVEEKALCRLGDSAPDLLVLHEHALLALAKAGCWSDARLQFSSLLVVSSTYANEVDPHELVAEAAQLLATHASLQTRIADADLLVERVESLGAARWLREVQSYDGLVELRVHAPQGTARVRIEHGEVHDARYWPRMRQGEELQGTAALSALLEARFGRLIAGPPQRVADADQGPHLRTAPSLLPQQSSTIAWPPRVSECGPSPEPSPGMSPATGGLISVPAAMPAMGMSSSPDAQPLMASSSRPNTASALAFVRMLAGGRGATARPRATALGTLAAAALAGAALWITAPTPRLQSALGTPPARAAERSVRPASGPPKPRLVATSAVAPISPRVAEPASHVAHSVAPSAADVALSVNPLVADLALSGTQASPDPASGVAASDDAFQAQAQPRAPASTGMETTRAASASPVRDTASHDVPELPLRLRRWLTPTPVQRRVIDAFWARVHKDFARAERLLSEAHALDPTDSEVAYQRALTYARQGRLEQTLIWARQARQLSPLDPAPIALEGDIQLLRNQLREAEQTWQQCIRVRPGYPGCVRRLEQLRSPP